MTPTRTALAYTTAQLRRITEGMLPHDPCSRPGTRANSQRQPLLPLELPRRVTVRGRVLLHHDREPNRP